MIEVRSVAQVRGAEEEAFRQVPEGTLMQRAAFALAISCANLLRDLRGEVVGARVVLLVGSGNNGGDALWAGAMLARRGCRVDAICLSDRVHAEGAHALQRAGGRFHGSAAAALIVDADVVVDGILGIGGSGGLRPEAAALADACDASDAVVVAVDLPSGVDADTGAVDGPAITADVTVTFGSVKPGLLLAPGCHHSGGIQLVDIGLHFADDPVAAVLDPDDVVAWVAEPDEGTYKYRRGVVGVAAGSGPYPGAAQLVTAAARHANVGMVRYLDRGDGVASTVVTAFPDVVIDGSPPTEQHRATAWGCGSGFTGDSADAPAVAAVLEARVPVVLDAGALSVVGESQDIRDRIASRHRDGLVTVLTPHEGEFERLQPGLLGRSPGRLMAALAASSELAAVVVLKGPGTVIASPQGSAWIDTEGTSDLGTAGSGDVLTGLVAAVLAGAWSDGVRDAELLAEAVAAGVWLHGRAGRHAGRSGPVTATDIAAAVPEAIASVRSVEP